MDIGKLIEEKGAVYAFRTVGIALFAGGGSEAAGAFTFSWLSGNSNLGLASVLAGTLFIVSSSLLNVYIKSNMKQAELARMQAKHLRTLSEAFHSIAEKEELAEFERQMNGQH
ncbi:hypothetical protein HED22_12470 [Thalassospira sp. HF15]|uniref:hypothetical protein n=1 Tax=Thalassospira sp. HF15 TaxID=2722755 RepID=UPI001430FA0F|nr:hypothetical protein [Thalassospira sp. HF15]NIY76456.1 hypothetical protein [Thalassospira sp. HF15]